MQRVLCTLSQADTKGVWLGGHQTADVDFLALSPSRLAAGVVRNAVGSAVDNRCDPITDRARISPTSSSPPYSRTSAATAVGYVMKGILPQLRSGSRQLFRPLNGMYRAVGRPQRLHAAS
jgi:hypothetical protein